LRQRSHHAPSALTLGVHVPMGWYGSSALMMAASVPTRDHMLAQPRLTVPLYVNALLD
jgi:hypothetical protein